MVLLLTASVSSFPQKFLKNTFRKTPTYWFVIVKQWQTCHFCNFVEALSSKKRSTNSGVPRVCYRMFSFNTDSWFATSGELHAWRRTSSPTTDPWCVSRADAVSYFGPVGIVPSSATQINTKVSAPHPLLDNVQDFTGSGSDCPMQISAMLWGWGQICLPGFQPGRVKQVTVIYGATKS